MSRRRFLSAAAMASLAPWRAPLARAAAPSGFRGTLSLFSKHLPDMDARQLGKAIQALGFAGVDLTVRKGGHVAPERAAVELPPFAARLREESVEIPFITTELVSAKDPAARPILETAAGLGITRFKPGYYRYAFQDTKAELERAAAELRGLAELGARSGVTLGFHNHAGYVGGPIWDIAPAIAALDPKWAGYYFDVRHAVVEGGDAGWRTAVSLVAPRLLMIAVKDFFWEKAASGWRQRHCALGEGMVDWKTFFAMLAKAGFQGPVSVHLEYEIPGATPAAKQENTLAAAARDLAFLKARLAEAYAGAPAAP